MRLGRRVGTFEYGIREGLTAADMGLTDAELEDLIE